MSDEILTTGEELPMEDQKKAINLQDLVYVKEYINRRQNDYETEMDDKYTNFESGMTNNFNTFTADMTSNNANFQNEMTADNAEFKSDIQSTIQNTIKGGMDAELADFQAQIDNIVDGTTTVTNSNRIQGIDLSSDDIAGFGPYFISRKKFAWSAKIDEEVKMTFDTDNNMLYISVDSAPIELLNAIQPNKVYELKGGFNGVNKKTFKCTFNTYDYTENTNSTTISVDGGDVFYIPNMFTTSGDLALFVPKFTFDYYPSDGTYAGRGNTSYVIGFKLITEDSDSGLNSSSYTSCYLKELYEIVE